MGDKKDFKDKAVFTTYDAARICNANIASIKNWIAKGLLRAFRTPGGHYRIKRRDLELFVQKYNMPYPFGDKTRKRVYLLGWTKRTAASVQKVVTPHHFKGFADPMEAALCIGLERPDVLLVDLKSTRFDGEKFLKLLQGYPDTRNIQVVVYSKGLTQAEEMELRKRGTIEDIVDRSEGPDCLMGALAHLL